MFEKDHRKPQLSMGVYHVPERGKACGEMGELLFWKERITNLGQLAPHYFIPQGKPGISSLFFLPPLAQK